MADLIAQGPLPHQRWRRGLPSDEPFVLGRKGGLWAVGWDDHISRSHARLHWQDGHLRVEKLPEATNPVFVAGEEVTQANLRPGEHFVIGTTTFTLTEDHVQLALDAPGPVEEKTFSAQYLQRVRYRNADHRIEVLSRLPDVISSAAQEAELFVGLVNMLLAGIPRADAVALVAVSPGAPDGPVRVLHWDRRVQSGPEFQPSERLIREAVEREQSVLHTWEAKDAGGVFTVMENVDWAFCTPIHTESSAGWAIYVAGHDPRESGTRRKSDESDLRDDLKFTELVGALLSALRQSQHLQRRQSTLSQFFAPAVLNAMAGDDPDVVLAPRETEVTVLFCDLRGFSRRAESNADDLLGLLDRVSKALGVMTHHILAAGGVLGDFQGDAAMGFWGWPLPQSDCIRRAARAALEGRREFEQAARQSEHALAGFRMGIGIATGKAVAGRIGTIDQVKVTVFGPVVNLASRLEGMTKILRAPILLDQPTAQFIRHHVPHDVARVRRLAVVKPYGLDRPVEVSELLPPLSEYPELTDEHLRFYESAVDEFLKGNWSESMELLQEVPAKDRVKDFLTVFIAQHNRTPPPNWDGVIPLLSKS